MGEAIRNDTLTEATNPITEGTDYSGYHAIHGVARRLLISKYPALVSDLVQILSDSHDCRSYEVLARELIPQEVEINGAVAKKIIHLAAQAAAANPNNQIDLRARESRVKTAVNFARNSGQTMVEALGRKPYSQEEMSFLVGLLRDPLYRWQTGSHKGKVMWSKVAERLNAEYNSGRESVEIMDQIKTMRYQRDSRLGNVPVILIAAEQDLVAEV